MDKLLSKLWSQTIIDETTGCWLWQGALDSDGYGMIRHEKKLYYIHKLAYELMKGPIPKGKQINYMLECPYRNCWFPDHLYDGTQAENMQDRSNLGNHPSQFGNSQHGINNSRAKFTIEEVREIRRLYKEKKFTQEELAYIYECGRMTISDAVNKRTYRDVD